MTIKLTASELKSIIIEASTLPPMERDKFRRGKIIDLYNDVIENGNAANLPALKNEIQQAAVKLGFVMGNNLFDRAIEQLKRCKAARLKLKKSSAKATKDFDQYDPKTGSEGNDYEFEKNAFMALVKKIAPLTPDSVIDHDPIERGERRREFWLKNLSSLRFGARAAIMGTSLRSDVPFSRVIRQLGKLQTVMVENVLVFACDNKQCKSVFTDSDCEKRINAYVDKNFRYFRYLLAS